MQTKILGYWESLLGRRSLAASRMNSNWGTTAPSLSRAMIRANLIEEEG